MEINSERKGSVFTCFIPSTHTKASWDLEEKAMVMHLMKKSRPTAFYLLSGSQSLIAIQLPKKKKIHKRSIMLLLLVNRDLIAFYSFDSVCASTEMHLVNLGVTLSVYQREEYWI